MQTFCLKTEALKKKVLRFCSKGTLGENENKTENQFVKVKLKKKKKGKMRAQKELLG
jgi:hypothetical protein